MVGPLNIGLCDIYMSVPGFFHSSHTFPKLSCTKSQVHTTTQPHKTYPQPQSPLHAEMSETITTRFLILSDTHGLSPQSTNDPKHGFRKDKMPSADVVLHCGDLTENGSVKDYEKAIAMLSTLDAELKLVIAGNHDLTLDRDHCLRERGNADAYDEAMKLWQGPTAKNAGIVFLHEEGVYTFTLRKSGASFTVYASPWTPQYGDSAFQYPTDRDRYNAISPAWAENVATERSRLPAFPGVDVVMTHGPPKYVLDDTGRGNSAGCEHLRRAICHARPRLHCFGHVHGGWGAQKVAWDNTGRLSPSVIGEEDTVLMPLPKEFVGKNSSRKRGYATVQTDDMRHGDQTLFVNAAIADEECTNAPWLIKLELPRKMDGQDASA